MTKHTFISYIVLLGLFLFTACEDRELEEININPNQPETVGADLILPGVIRDAVNTVVNESFLAGTVIAQHTAKSLRVEIDKYDWGPLPDTWFGLYNVLRDVENIRQIGVETGNANYEAIALIWKSWIFSILTDTYEDIPYSQAIEAKSDNNFFPTYDSQQDIYTGPEGLLANLERANQLLDPNGPLIGGDILFNGDIELWKRFGNSLRLRLLMRISDKIDVNAQMQQIIDNEMIMEGNAHNAALGYLNVSPNRFPLITIKAGDFAAVNISKTLTDKLLELNDPRLMEFARPTSSTIGTDNPQYVGLENGDLNAKSQGEKSLLGFRYFQNNPTDKEPEGLIMTYSELNFILAEAVEKGMVSAPRTVEDYYREGIRSSMEYYEVEWENVTVDEFETYYDQQSVDLGSATDRLAKIAEQKWISLFFVGMEAFFDFKRTGLPALEPPQGNTNQDQIPNRFLYPGEEQSLNQQNYQAAAAAIGGDNINSASWWKLP